MKFRKLEVVVLRQDIPESGLLTGDLGTVVDLYPPDGIEVEFVRGSGETQALLTLSERDLRKINSRDFLSTRRMARVT
jgi:hypothetical protein